MIKVEYPWRMRIIWLLLFLAIGLVVWRLVDLNLTERSFLQSQGDARMERTVPLAAQRGMITDRNGKPLAVSAPVVSLWANPQVLRTNNESVRRVAAVLNMELQPLRERLYKMGNKEFMYLRRHMNPEQALDVLDLAIPGLYGQREFHRYYPAGEVTTHLIGFNDVDDRGQEGMELAYDHWLRAQAGSKLVKKDRKGRTVEDLRILQVAVPGQNVQLSIDLRMQYVAYRELKAVVQQHRAKSAAAVIMDVHTGEVLAMVNQPSYNPNKRNDRVMDSLRNRALTDVVEPGSTVKPLTIAAALMSGRYDVDSEVNTSPGYLKVRGKVIRDHRDYGILDITGIITKSSNVGVAKLALSMPENGIRDTFYRFGLGQDTGTGFPGESVGILPSYARWNPIDLVTMAYGYGVAVTPIQLARAYSVLASHGLKRPVSLLKLDQVPEAERVMPVETARQVVNMMETVTQLGGTGTRARVPAYRVAGKTGTVHKPSQTGGYEDDAYTAIFAGIVPATRPRLVCVVIVDQPQGEQYHGGEVAAPVFSRMMAESLRLLNIAPDNS